MKNTSWFRVCYSLAIFLVSSIFVSGGVSATLRTQLTSDSITLQYSFVTPTISQIYVGEKCYDVIHIEHLGCFGHPGEPYLPVRGAYILLPYNTQVVDIIVSGEKTSLGKGFTVVPTPKPVPLIDAPVIPVPDEGTYSSTEEVPGELFSTVGVYSFRGYQILVLRLYPVQYIPASGEILFYSSLEVTVQLTPIRQQKSLHRGLSDDRRILQEKIDNPQVISTYATQYNRGSDEYDLLILTKDEFKDGFLPLKNKHDADGVPTVIKTLTDVGSTDPEDIRHYIRDAYLSWGVEYVLLGGDEEVIPARQLWVFGLDEDTTPYSTEMPSDLYYACLDGPYNFDSDDKWGETTDGENGGDVDLVADVYVGRACVGTIDEVDYFVQKTVSYMQSTGTYLDVFTFAGEYLGNYGVASWGGNYLDQLINGSSADGYTTVGIPAENYTIDKLYDRDWPGHDWPKSEIMNRINNGIHVINHIGHSYYEYNMKMNTNDVYSLTNQQFCFIYSQGCMAGGFDNPEGNDCIAEVLTAKTAHGAFAAIMNARYGFFWSFSTDGDSQRYHREFWDAVFNEGKTNLGQVNHDSKEDNLYMIDRSCMRWVYYETNLFGDPAVALKVTSNPPQPKPILEIRNITGGFGITAVIMNTGDAQATDINWTICVSGGILNRIHKQTNGMISQLPENTSQVISHPWFFGLGTIEITLVAICPQTSIPEQTLQGKQLFVYTKIVP
ncbi:MAG: C25 family cysteine peptidase [Candidatus Thermoplasmatota archaeon]